MRRIVTAREQVHMLAPWITADQHEMLYAPMHLAFIKEARYPQEWSGDAPYGRFPSGRARNRPPSVLSDPDDPSSEIIDPSEIIYKKRGDSVSAFHPNGDHLGNYSWEEDSYGGYPHIGIAQVNPQYHSQGVGNAIIDHIRENYEPNLVHSGYQGNGSLSYQGRAGALRDLGNTEEEHNDYFNTRPYNYGESSPAQFYVTHPDTGDRELFPVTEAQRKAHLELMKQFEEDRAHPNYTGETSSGGSGDPEMRDEYGNRYEYGYDPEGNYVGYSNGTKDSEGYSEDGYNHEGYDRNGYDHEGYDSEGYDEDGYHRDTGLDREGQTRHGYTPGDGTPPEGTVPMSQMSSHWYQHGLSPASPEHEQMMDDAANTGLSPTMYAVREPGQVSPDSGLHHVGNGDTVYSSLDRARQVAYHPDDPSQDKNIVSVDHLDPSHLHTDASGATPEDFHYAPDSRVPGYDVEDTTSKEADVVHDPQRQQRILGDLGHGWSASTMLPLVNHSGMEYTDPDSGRGGRMYLADNGSWWAEHQPEFGGRRRSNHASYLGAAQAIREGTQPGPTMDQHALEVNNDYQASGEGTVDWEPHPNGQGLTARTPHGDLHVVQDPDTGRWNWHAGPHGSQPGDEGNLRAMLPDSLFRSAQSGIQALNRSPFHGGLADELGEGWGPHPRSPGAYSRRLPSGNHAFVAKNPDGTYGSGIQRDNGNGAPSTSLAYRDDMPDLSEALAFIHHRENPVPASKLGQGWEDLDRGRQHFPTYLHESHPSGAKAHVAWDVNNGGGWRAGVSHNGEDYDSHSHKTPQDAAAWASSLMDDLGAGNTTNRFV